ncbi:putative vitamin K-dependent gamma-carboxylase, partial [Trypoxylus dichotomus]
MYKETDPSSLAVVRIFFGILMMVDIIEERGGSDLDIRWGEPRDCHFPLFNQLQPLSFAYMSLLYGVMWLGALGVALGCKFRLSCLMFCVPYWYLFLLDKSYWNNHSYLYGLIGILLLCSSANNY